MKEILPNLYIGTYADAECLVVQVGGGQLCS